MLVAGVWKWGLEMVEASIPYLSSRTRRLTDRSTRLRPRRREGLPPSVRRRRFPLQIHQKEEEEEEEELSL